MEIWQRCDNCSPYPFCTDIVKPTGWCEKWKKKPRPSSMEKDMKLENTDGINFNFKEV